MKNIFIFAIFSILTQLYIPASALEKIIACHEVLSEQKLEHLSPIYALPLINNPFLENLRFVGMYGSEENAKKNYPKYSQVTRKDDQPLTATSTLMQHMLPYTLAVSGREFFLFRHIGMKNLALLVVSLERARLETLENDLFQMSTPGKTKSVLKREKQFSLYSRLLIEAREESKSDPYSLSPYFVQYLLTAYARLLSLSSPNTHNFDDFLDALAPGCLQRQPNTPILTKEGYFTWKASLCKSDIFGQSFLTTDQSDHIFKDPLWAFQIAEASFLYEEIPIRIAYGKVQIDSIEFSNCSESGLESLILFLLFNPETNTLDLEKLPESAADNLKELLREYDPRKPSGFMGRWAQIFANLKDPQIVYRKTNGVTRCEVVSGIPNCLAVLAEVLGIPELAEALTTIVDRVRILTKRFLGEETPCTIELDLDEQTNRPISFNITRGPLEFDFESTPGHTETTYRNTQKISNPRLPFEKLPMVIAGYTPLYAHLVPFIFGDRASAYKRIVLREAGNYNETLDQQASVVSSATEDALYKLLLCTNLRMIDGSYDFIDTIVKRQATALSHHLPALNLHLALGDPYTDMLTFSKLIRTDASFVEEAFPGLIARIQGIIKEKPGMNFSFCLSRAIDYELLPIKRNAMDSMQEKVLELFSEPPVLAKLREDFKNPEIRSHIVQSLSSIISCTIQMETVQLFKRRLIELLSEDLPNLLKSRCIVNTTICGREITNEVPAFGNILYYICCTGVDETTQNLVQGMLNHFSNQELKELLLEVCYSSDDHTELTNLSRCFTASAHVSSTSFFNNVLKVYCELH